MSASRDHRFFRYLLRTTDVAGARAFYEPLFGKDGFDVFPLHERALARGARPHWLGHIAVEDVDAAAEVFVERGATRLGPTVATADGALAVLLDPGGAVVGLATRPPDEARVGPNVVWHELNTTDVEAARASYAALFGWETSGRLDLGSLGLLTTFTWTDGGPTVGSMAEVTARPGVHPHWLFHVRVPALDRAVETVRVGGGTIMPLVSLPNGERVAVCDDPQGGAFALRAW
jgi:predicted enzyme related to lactoylglutathione lyase